MTLEELVQTTTALFEAHIDRCKRGEELKPGFWMVVNEELKYHQFGALAPFLNSGEGKDFLFAVVRHWIERYQATAVFFVTESYMFVPNEKGLAEPDVVKTMTYQDGLKATAAAGYGTVYQALWVNGMTAEWYTAILRKFETMVVNGTRRLVFHGELEKEQYPLTSFAGRMKMYGPITEAEVQHRYDEVAPHINNLIQEHQ